MQGDRGGRGERGGRGGHGGPGEPGLGIWAELDLTPEQQEALTALLETHRETMRGLREDLRAGSITREEFHAAALEQREALEAEVREILTDEQEARLEELRCERRAERAAEQLERLGDHLEVKIDFLTRVLALDEAQQTELRSILEGSLDRMRDLLEQVQACTLSREEAREARAEIRDETAAAIGAILTEEQAQRFDALRELMHGRGPGGAGVGAHLGGGLR
jgi:Spy/CpxP family protein refolding chaperone